MSGSEDGEILFWDFGSKEIAQRASGHEGVVCWVDISGGVVASGGMDGTVRMWMDVDGNNNTLGGIDESRFEHGNGVTNGGDESDMVKMEMGEGYSDDLRAGATESTEHMGGERMDVD